MNLEKLFEMQRVLDERIVREKGLEGQDLLSKKVRALLTEFGELSNEERSFKFWSEDRKPRTEVKIDCSTCIGTGDSNAEAHMESMMEGHGPINYEKCDCCGGTGIWGYSNPLLEEYVDCLHFILSIGNELGLGDRGYTPNEDYLKIIKSLGINKILIGLISTPVKLVNGLHETREFQSIYSEIIIGFRVLGELLEFTWEQIEAAYYAKNEINHERQRSGY